MQYTTLYMILECIHTCETMQFTIFIQQVCLKCKLRYSIQSKSLISLKPFLSNIEYAGLFSFSYPDCSAIHSGLCGPLSSVLSDSPWSNSTSPYNDYISVSLMIFGRNSYISQLHPLCQCPRFAVYR